MRPVATYTVVSSLPEPLKRLSELAFNVRWSWDHQTIELFRRIDADLWEETGHNPVRMLGMISQSRLNAVSMDESFLANMEHVLESFDEYLASGKRAWYPQEFGKEEVPQIAYFSFEFGLTEAIPIYSGGLGVLAGDHLKAASDLNIPLMGVGLLYQQGYFRQYLNADGWQQETYPENDFYTMPLRQVRGSDGQVIKIAVEFPGRQVWARVWQVEVGRVVLYLLDTNIPDNPNPDDQNLTDQLYGGDREWRIKQEILLGIGGLRALLAMGLEPAVCHMNEGHAAFMALERARILMQQQGLSFRDAASVTAASNVFTTHTPVSAGNDYFAPSLVESYFQQYRQLLGLSDREFLALGRINPASTEEDFCMTVMALRMSAYANGVSRLHGEVARKMWQGVYPQVPAQEVPIHSITNGVHLYTWVSRDLANLYDRYLGPRWREDPTDREVWQRVHNIPGEELWRVHELRRERLVTFVRRRLVAQLENRGAPPSEIETAQDVLDPDVLTIGFARRFATYKRATLLLHDIERFQRILCGERPIQFIFAGKAHPHDNAGKEFIKQMVHFAESAECGHQIVFLENYDMTVARYMVQGVDVWLNTPRRPLEASGTSGMKAALNGVLNLSVLDGWWAEAYRRTLGWAIGKGEEYTDEALQDYVESNAVYELMERDMIPTFYERGGDNLPRVWVARIKQMLVELGPVFNTSRMVQEYTRRFYQPALESSRLLSADNFSRGRSYASWLSNLQSNWHVVKIDGITADMGEEVRVGDLLRVAAEVYLGPIEPGDVSVECYEGQLDIDGSIKHGHAHPMPRVGDGKKKGWHTYAVDVNTAATGLNGFTLRVIPAHADIPKTLRLGLIRWAAE
jgi:starch phosphorylase